MQSETVHQYSYWRLTPQNCSKISMTFFIKKKKEIVLTGTIDCYEEETKTISLFPKTFIYFLSDIL